jgi:uroporphyrinogen-III synthase
MTALLLLEPAARAIEQDLSHEMALVDQALLYRREEKECDRDENAQRGEKPGIPSGE